MKTYGQRYCLRSGAQILRTLTMCDEHLYAYFSYQPPRVGFIADGAGCACGVQMCNVPACENAPGELNQSGINVFHHQIVPYYQQQTVERWANAIAKINKTRDVLFHNCDIGCAPAEGVASAQPRPWGEWCRETANLWRTSGDINVLEWRQQNLASLVGRGSYAGPGGWNYPDSLEVGNCRRDKCIHGAEARAHFSLCETELRVRAATH